MQQFENGVTHVAVMGTGSAGMKHLAALKRLEGVQPIAVPRRKERLSQLEDMGYHTAEDLDAAIQAGATLCIVATDTNRHIQDCHAAIDGGLNVLCEKPLAPNAREAKELCARAKDAGREIFVGCVLRFSDSLSVFRQRCPEVGQLHFVRIECQSYLPDWRPARPYQQSYSARPIEGGVLLDLIHEIDHAGWLFGWPGSVQARLSNLGRLNIAACEIAELSWQAAGGCLMSISLDYLSRPPHRTMRAFGEYGTISWDWYAGKVDLKLAGGQTEEWLSSQTVDDMFVCQAQAFIERSLGAGDSRIATCGDGVKALAICDAASRSSERQHEERVEYP